MTSTAEYDFSKKRGEIKAYMLSRYDDPEYKETIERILQDCRTGLASGNRYGGLSNYTLLRAVLFHNGRSRVTAEDLDITAKIVFHIIKERKDIDIFDYGSYRLLPGPVNLENIELRICSNEPMVPIGMTIGDHIIVSRRRVGNTYYKCMLKCLLCGSLREYSVQSLHRILYDNRSIECNDCITHAIEAAINNPNNVRVVIDTDISYRRSTDNRIEVRCKRCGKTNRITIPEILNSALLQHSLRNCKPATFERQLLNANNRQLYKIWFTIKRENNKIIARDGITDEFWVDDTQLPEFINYILDEVDVDDLINETHTIRLSRCNGKGLYHPDNIKIKVIDKMLTNTYDVGYRRGVMTITEVDIYDVHEARRIGYKCRCRKCGAIHIIPHTAFINAKYKTHCSECVTADTGYFADLIRDAGFSVVRSKGSEPYTVTCNKCHRSKGMSVSTLLKGNLVCKKCKTHV